MQDSTPLKTPAVVLKKKRKKINLMAKQTGVSLRLKECDEKDFILLEWALLNGMKLLFQVPVDKINTLIKECHGATVMR